MYINEITEELTATLAHEVKNPVSLIKANLELLELEGNFNNCEKNINVIKKELNKISTIISDFTLLCKSSDNSVKDRLNLLDLIKDTIEDYSISNIKNNLKFYCNCFCKIDDLYLEGIEYKINILFSNIYKNAIESIIHESGEIYTSIYKKNKKVVIDIIDNGTGIEENIKNSICTPFVTSKDTGSGLGLAICKNIMDELNGQFTIFNNTDSNGCTVRLVF